MVIGKVKKLIELLEASDVAEIEINEGDETVRISRSPTINLPIVKNTQAPVQRNEIEVENPKKTTSGHAI